MKNIFVFLIFSVNYLYGQQLNSSEWTVTRTTDLHTGENIGYHCSFMVFSDRVEWRQKNVAANYRFEVRGYTGNWNDLSLPGRVSADVIFRGLPGTIEFSNDGTETQVRLRVFNGEKDLFPFLFSVSKIKKN